MAIGLTKYQGEIAIKCEIKMCGKKGIYLLGEGDASLSQQFILCEKCVKAVAEAVKASGRSRM